MGTEHVHQCECGARWDEDHDADGERARRQVEFLEILADGGGITVNGVPWREMFERLNAIVSDPVPIEGQGSDAAD